MEPQVKSNKSVGIIIGVIVVLAVIIATVMFGKKSPEVAPATDQTSSLPPADTTSKIPPTDTTKHSTSVYKDGTYSATGSYMSPGGPDKVGVTLTLKNDIITDLTFTPMPGDQKSEDFQNWFASGIKAFAVGKNISTLNVGKVSGSSLTGKGFNDALAQIKAQAKA
jgi:uncharacterized protein with FMN-binding domain